MAVSVVFAVAMVVASQPSTAHPKVADPAPTAPTTSAAPPTTTTTGLPIVVTIRPTTTTTRLVAVRTPAAPTPAPATTAAPRVRTTGTESCGWAWDATHFDDGTVNEVTISLNAPRRAGAAAAVQAVPHGSNVPMVRTVALDGAGNGAATFTLTNDKRDWTVTVSAQFVGGGVCGAQTFTITYE